MQQDQMDVKLQAVLKTQAEGKALSSGLLPSSADIMKLITGDTASTRYFAALFRALWEENQRLKQEIETIKKAHDILKKGI